MGWFDDGQDVRSRRGPGWADGYTVDANYPGPMVVDLSPVRLSTAALLHGQPPIDLEGPITWVDLGCGQGLSACMVAASNPNVEVWGFDFNPAHVERARRLARAAGLDNCRFAEAGFAELAADPKFGPSEVDVFTVNGVYSWIAPGQQARITEVVGQRLVPGGLAFVMYESPAGWASMIPVAEAMHVYASFDGRPADVVFDDAAAAMMAVAQGGGRTFPLGPQEMTQVESWSSAHGALAAHEYLGGHFGPLMFDQVAPLMAEARCSFVGSIDMTDHLSRFWVRPELIDLVHSSNDVTLRELMRELINQQPLRRDLFRRGLLNPGDAALGHWVSELRLTSLGRPFEAAPVVAPSGGIGLDPALYEPLVRAVDDGQLGIDGILSIHTHWTFDDAATAMSLLVAGGYASFLHPAGITASTFAASRRLNEVLIAENRTGADHSALVSPALGSAVEADPMEMEVIGDLWSGAAADPDELTSARLHALQAAGRVVRDGYELVHDPAEAERIVRKRVEAAIEKNHGLFVTLGISG